MTTTYAQVKAKLGRHERLALEEQAFLESLVERMRPLVEYTDLNCMGDKLRSEASKILSEITPS